MRDPELSIAGWLLLGQAKTLRERAFARLVGSVQHDAIEFSHAPQQLFQVHPVERDIGNTDLVCLQCGFRRTIRSWFQEDG